MGSYVPSTPAQRQEMLEAIGLHDFRQLYRDVPEEMLLRDGLDLPEGMSELEVSRTMTAMAARNTAYSAILHRARHIAAACGKNHYRQQAAQQRRNA